MGRSKSLAARIKGRQQEAERKRIRRKAELVAEHLGERSSLNPSVTMVIWLLRIKNPCASPVWHR